MFGHFSEDFGFFERKENAVFRERRRIGIEIKTGIFKRIGVLLVFLKVGPISFSIEAIGLLLLLFKGRNPIGFLIGFRMTDLTKKNRRSNRVPCFLSIWENEQIEFGFEPIFQNLGIVAEQNTPLNHARTYFDANCKFFSFVISFFYASFELRHPFSHLEIPLKYPITN